MSNSPHTSSRVFGGTLQVSPDVSFLHGREVQVIKKRRKERDERGRLLASIQTDIEVIMKRGRSRDRQPKRRRPCTLSPVRKNSQLYHASWPRFETFLKDCIQKQETDLCKRTEAWKSQLSSVEGLLQQLDQAMQRSEELRKELDIPLTIIQKLTLSVNAFKSASKPLERCPICMEHYADTQLPNCLHWICLLCYEKLVTKYAGVKSRCPTCRADFFVLSKGPEASSSSSPVHDFINDVLSSALTSS